MRSSLVVWLLLSGVGVCFADEWRNEVLLQTEQGMGGVAIGDLDPSIPGNEVAVVNGAGEAWLVGKSDEGWTSQRICKGSGEMKMCAIGDMDPRSPGNEFVAVGMVEGTESTTGRGQALLARRDGDGWISEPIFQDSHMLHGVAVGDVSRKHDGDEIIVCGFNHRVTLLCLTEKGWHSEVIYVANDRLKIIEVVYYFGLGVLAAGSDGRVVLLKEGELGWRHEVVYSSHVGQSRAAGGGERYLIGGDDGVVTLATKPPAVPLASMPKPSPYPWRYASLGRDTAKIRGVAIANLDPGVRRDECYSCGYSGRVTQYSKPDGRQGYWQSKVLLTDERPLHHLAVGDFDSEHEGNELVTCGHSGKLIALYPPKGK